MISNRMKESVMVDALQRLSSRCEFHLKLQTDLEPKLVIKRRKCLSSSPSISDSPKIGTASQSPLVRIDTFFADSTVTNAFKGATLEDLGSADSVTIEKAGLGLKTFKNLKKNNNIGSTRLQHVEWMDGLLDNLGQRFPRWKHRCFGLKRFYCHKFNIRVDDACYANYSRILSTISNGNCGVGEYGGRVDMGLKLLTIEYGTFGADTSDINVYKCDTGCVSTERSPTLMYSSNHKVDRTLKQLDEIVSCFCSFKCAFDFNGYISHICRTDRMSNDSNNGGETGVSPEECFASVSESSESGSKIGSTLEFFAERGILHCFGRPYLPNTFLETTESFSRAAVCASCGKIVRCRCAKRLFRVSRKNDKNNRNLTATAAYVNIDDKKPKENHSEADLYAFLNSVRNEERISHPITLKTSMSIAHAYRSDFGVVHCLSIQRNKDKSKGAYVSPPKPLFPFHSRFLFKLTMLRGGIEDIFGAIAMFSSLLSLPELADGELLSMWKAVPRHRSWRRCWWRCIKNLKIDSSLPQVELYVNKTLEQLDALGNVRYDKSLGFIAIGHLQKRSRCCYWRFFYVSERGLWTAFTKAVEYFVLMNSLPLEISLDIKPMHWTVCKCHQGEMFRKSFSTTKHGVLRGYAMAIKWFEQLLRDLNFSDGMHSDFEDEEDLGHDDLLKHFCLIPSECVSDSCSSVADVFSLAKRRKLILLGSTPYNSSDDKCIPRNLSSGEKKSSSSNNTTGKNVDQMQYNTILDYNLWFSDIERLFRKDDPTQNGGTMYKDKVENFTLRKLVTQFTELREPFVMSVQQLNDCVNTLRTHLSNLVEINKDVAQVSQSVDKCGDGADSSISDSQLPMQWVCFHRNSDSWTCALESTSCLICAPHECQNLSTCVMFSRGHETIEAIAKRLKPCALRYTAHPFYKESPGICNNKGTVEGCCIVGFSAGKFGFSGAKALATEFRRKFLRAAHEDLKYDGNFAKALFGIIANELAAMASTDAYIVEDSEEINSQKYMQKDANVLEDLHGNADEANVSSKARSNSFGEDEAMGDKDICFKFGKKLMSKNGSLDVEEVLQSKLPTYRLSEIFGLEQIATSLLKEYKLERVAFCPHHCTWVVWWYDCMQQRRLMFHKIEYFLDTSDVESLISRLDLQWTEAVSLHSQKSDAKSCNGVQNKKTCQVLRAFEIVFSLLISLQNKLYEALASSFATALRAIADALHESKFMKRLWQVHKNGPNKDRITKDLHSQSLAFADALVFPFGSLHDEGTPPFSEEGE